MYHIFFSKDGDAYLEAVSPVNIVLIPPDKLVIEVRSIGGYYQHAWYRNDVEIFPNGDMNFAEDNPSNFLEFFQVYVEDPTSTSSHGVYRVDLLESNDNDDVLRTQEFTVTPQGEHIFIVTSQGEHILNPQFYRIATTILSVFVKIDEPIMHVSTNFTPHLLLCALNLIG